MVGVHDPHICHGNIIQKTDVGCVAQPITAPASCPAAAVSLAMLPTSAALGGYKGAKGIRYGRGPVLQLLLGQSDILLFKQQKNTEPATSAKARRASEK
ncbi:hypothetical protein [Eubacterium callanderi]|uniref:hypothetical protein n=1 Tax=Eubacterium callanderi TaxID=53442 RepID=UPI001FAC5005